MIQNKLLSTGTQGNKWIRAHIVIPSSSPPFQLVFEGIRGTSYSGDLAIDDIAVKPAELCGISSGKVNFEFCTPLTLSVAQYCVG